MPSSNLLSNDDLDDLDNSPAYYPHTSPAGQVDPIAVAANELLKLRTEIKSHTSNKPTRLEYDLKTSTIRVGDNTINLRRYSKEAMLCDVILRDPRSRKREWNTDEIVERWRGLGNDPNDQSYSQRMPSDAADRINRHFEGARLPDLFPPPNGQVIKMNTIYL